MIIRRCSYTRTLEYQPRAEEGGLCKQTIFHAYISRAIVILNESHFSIFVFIIIWRRGRKIFFNKWIDDFSDSYQRRQSNHPPYPFSFLSDFQVENGRLKKKNRLFSLSMSSPAKGTLGKLIITLVWSVQDECYCCGLSLFTRQQTRKNISTYSEPNWWNTAWEINSNRNNEHVYSTQKKKPLQKETIRTMRIFKESI